MDYNRRKFLKISGLASLSFPFAGIGRDDAKEVLNPRPVIKPNALKTGDTIAISSPAGAVWDDAQVVKFSSILQNLGFKVKTGETLSKKFGYFAGSDEFRANEINRLFQDKEVKAIFCMKGGWGCARILNLINYSEIIKNPKIIMGFSDITSLLISINAITGLITFHGPVGNSGWNDFSTGYVKKILMDKEIVSYTYPEKNDDLPYTVHPGKSKGRLVGGNLSVLSGIVGSHYLPDWKNKILFLEETGEEPYQIDRMLTQLKLAGILHKLSGFIFGKCVKCEAEEPTKAFTFQQVLEQHIKPLGIPAFYGAMIGHIENKYTIPLGIEAEMDADKCSFKLLETAVI